jgi:penicillin-binding protein 2
METRVSVKSALPRPLLVGVIIIAGFIILGSRFFQLQVVYGEYYKELADRNRVSEVPIPAPRGKILDRNGKLLAKNTLQSSVFYIVSGNPDFDSTAIAKLATFLDVPLERQNEICAMALEVEPETVVPVKTDIPKSTVIKLEERSDQFMRTIIETEAGRSYPYGRYAAHIVGYIGPISAEQYEQKKHLGYSSTDVVGKYGTEDMYDPILRGKQGAKKLLVDVTGRVRGVKMRPAVDARGEEMFDERGNPLFEDDTTPSEPGTDIELTIDIDLQAAIVPLMRDRPGAVVVMDPSDGAILAIVSSPTFDPNLFGGRVASGDWTALVNDEGRPLQNRSIQNAYPPGSTFKPVTAWAALDAGKITGQTSVFCDGSFELGPGVFRCWKTWGHGKVDFVEAMAYSCDVFFYNAGYETGATAIAERAKQLGLGAATGIDLPGEVAGRIADADWKLAHIGEKWYGGDTVNMAIGQGFMQTTPLQMAVMTAAFANGGKLVTPHLLKLFKEAAPRPVGMNPGHLDFIRRGMRAAVAYTEGTAHQLYGLPFTLAAKTGTAQDPPRENPHSWLAVFAPYEDAGVVLLTFLENVPDDEPGALSLAKEILSLPEMQVYIVGD